MSLTSSRKWAFTTASLCIFFVQRSQQQGELFCNEGKTRSNHRRINSPQWKPKWYLALVGFLPLFFLHLLSTHNHLKRNFCIGGTSLDLGFIKKSIGFNSFVVEKIFNAESAHGEPIG